MRIDLETVPEFGEWEVSPEGRRVLCDGFAVADHNSLPAMREALECCRLYICNNPALLGSDALLAKIGSALQHEGQLQKAPETAKRES